MADARLTVGALALLLAGIAAGCASAPPPSPPISRVLEQVSQAGLSKAGEIIEQHLREQETVGYAAPFVPVVLPPEIRRVWVLTHVSPDGHLVSGHWVYLRLHDWRWFIETEATPLRLGSVPAAPAIAPTPPMQPSGTDSGRGVEPRGSRPVLPWTVGSRPDGPRPDASGSGLEVGSVPTVQIPAPGGPPPVALPALPRTIPPSPAPAGPAP